MNPTLRSILYLLSKGTEQEPKRLSEEGEEERRERVALPYSLDWVIAREMVLLIRSELVDLAYRGKEGCWEPHAF